MELDGYGIAKDFILPLVGIVAGIFTTKWVTNSWQIKKETNAIKSKIILDYGNSFKHIGMLTSLFFYKIYNSYVDWSQVKGGEESLSRYIVFPKDEKEQPSHRFSQQFHEYLEEYDKTRFLSSKFISSLRFYYKDTPLVDSVRKIAKSNNELREIIRRIMHCKDEITFLLLIKEYSNEDSNNNNVIEEFEKRLVDIPIKLEK